MKLEIKEKNAKNLQMGISVVLLALVAWIAVTVTGFVALPLDSVIIFLATIGAILIACGLLMLLRKTDRSTGAGFVMVVIGAVLEVVCLLSYYGLWLSA